MWTWQTFWWTPNATPLDVGNPQFRHFDFGTAYWTVDTQPGSTMNLGETTNCISCHQQATYTVSAYPSPVPYYVAHDDQPQIATPP
ncbi:MAG TPA: hypothetical protein VNF68_14250, partial [Candidatus Baltobacteraceae bacterium]|nr:hypothetical protein [Candidatus Baltobacteraceae bacterium]